MKASLVAPLTATYEGQLAYKSLQNRQKQELFFHSRSVECSFLGQQMCFTAQLTFSCFWTKV